MRRAIEGGKERFVQSRISAPGEQDGELGLKQPPPTRGVRDRSGARGWLGKLHVGQV